MTPGDPDEEPTTLATHWLLQATTGDETPTGIRGEPNRPLLNGNYTDGECGVSAIVNGVGGWGDALLRTDWRPIRPRDSAACEGRERRSYVADLTSPLGGSPDRGFRAGAFTNLHRVGSVEVGEATQDFGAAFNLEGCDLRMGIRRVTNPDGSPRLWPGTDLVRIEAGENESGARVWVVESTGNHRAMCVTHMGDEVTEPQGDLDVVPFRIVITGLDRSPAHPF